MARITIEDCLNEIPNRFELTVLALREIAAGKIGLEMLKKVPS